MGQSDRSSWPVIRLDLSDLALRDHRSVLVEVFVPQLFYLLLPLLFVPQALQLSLLGMSQPWRTPLGLMVVVCHLVAAGLMIIGRERFLSRRSS